MRLRGLIAVAVACACTYACARKQPPQQPLLRNARAVERPPPDAAPPAVATCEDVGAAVNGMDGRYDADTVARECEAAAWPESVRTCLATDAADCLAELSEEQRFQWMGVVESAATVGQPASCDLINVEYVEPVVAEDAPELQWLHAARTHVVIRECRRGWPAELRDCLANTYDQDKGHRCVEVNLDDKARAALEKSLAALPKLAAKIEKLRKTPTKVECEDVVDVRYADARWKGKLVDLPAAERAKAIEASRQQMYDACVDYDWDAATRACVVAARDLFPCFDDQYIQLWGYPAAFIH